MNTTKISFTRGITRIAIIFMGLAAATTSARADLLAFYEFDNSGDPFLDSSPNGTHITGTVLLRHDHEKQIPSLQNQTRYENTR
jgi:hypothetical protein